ncbi:MAG TPA: hypothetical protein VIM30_13425 [Candidatus Limnocylindrales bacterium]|jgi:hypothetical protein
MHCRSTKVIAVLAALVAVIGAPAMASASSVGGGTPPPTWGTITVTIGSTASLTAKLLAKVPVDVTCSLNAAGITANASTAPDRTGVFVEVDEAVGKSIASGFGSAGPFPCDGTTTHFLVSVQSQNCCPGVPFKTGKAIVSASGEADWGPFDLDTGTPAGTAFGVAGPQVLRLR